MSSILVSRFGVSLVPVESPRKNTNTPTSDLSFLQEIPPFQRREPRGLDRCLSDISLSLTARSISESPVKPKVLREPQPSPLPRSPSPLALIYVKERSDERSEQKSSHEHEKIHALYFFRKVISDLEEGRVFPAIASASMISLPQERILSECEIFEKVYHLAKKYLAGSEKFKKYESIAWESLNRAFAIFTVEKKVLDPAICREIEDILLRHAALP